MAKGFIFRYSKKAGKVVKCTYAHFGVCVSHRLKIFLLIKVCANPNSIDIFQKQKDATYSDSDIEKVFELNADVSMA